ncbi:MAG: hypothetical protein ACRDFB_08710 [Rhabdochlamydiaceae bacterium]
MANRVAPMETVAVPYNNNVINLQKKTILILPDGREIAIDASREIANIVTVNQQGKTLAIRILYKDSPEDIIEFQNLEKKIDRFGVRLIHQICKSIGWNVEHTDELKRIDDEVGRQSTADMSQIEEGKKAQEKEEIQKEIEKRALQPKSKWVYFADGLATVGGLYIAFKVVEFIVKKKPGQFLYGIFVTVKGTVYR